MLKQRLLDAGFEKLRVHQYKFLTRLSLWRKKWKMFRSYQEADEFGPQPRADAGTHDKPNAMKILMEAILWRTCRNYLDCLYTRKSYSHFLDCPIEKAIWIFHRNYLDCRFEKPILTRRNYLACLIEGSYSHFLEEWNLYSTLHALSLRI